jgi:hypothetical protein
MRSEEAGIFFFLGKGGTPQTGSVTLSGCLLRETDGMNQQRGGREEKAGVRRAAGRCSIGETKALLSHKAECRAGTPIGACSDRGIWSWTPDCKQCIALYSYVEKYAPASQNNNSRITRYVRLEKIELYTNSRRSTCIPLSSKTKLFRPTRATHYADHVSTFHQASTATLASCGLSSTCSSRRQTGSQAASGTPEVRTARSSSSKGRQSSMNPCTSGWRPCRTCRPC